MKVLFFGQWDWSNTSHRVARAINATGLAEARVCVQFPHPLGYQEDMVVERGSHDEAVDWIKSADWIVNTGGNGWVGSIYFTSMVALLKPRARYATIHPGPEYRHEADHWNKNDAEIGYVRRFIGGDLYRFALDDPKAVPYFAPPHIAPTDVPVPLNGRVRVSHSPSSRGTKNTDAIVAAAESIDVDFDLIENVSFAECAARRARSHIFVDQVHDEIGGFGAAAVEAISSGCAVLADVHNIVPQVNNFYPPPPIIDVSAGRRIGDVQVGNDSLKAALADLVTSPERLEAARQDSLVWAREHASQDAIARYWLEQLA